MKKNNMMKCVVTGVMTVAILLSGIVISPKDAKEAEAVALTEDKVCYDEVAGKDFKELYGAQQKKAPTKEGYLFGGWYKDEGATPITTETDLSSIANDATVYAKFVPAYVLSVKSQNYANTTESTDKTNKTTTRVISTVDKSLLYSEVGFEVIINGKEKVEVKTTKVWEKLAVNTGDARKEYTATNIFGDVSEYFFVLNIQNIPETKWAEQIYVRPYWITADETKVWGLGKHVYVEDGVKGYISVPVNLNNVSEELAAGILKVDYDETKMTFKECVTGRIFEEMESADIENNGNKYVNCVGNVETLQGVKKDDIYITLRFEVSETMEERTEPYKFTISNEDFVDLDENEIDLSVWDVQY